MKKLIYILSTLLLASACSSDDNSSDEVIDPNDIDGDGVTNQQEAIDNTNPNNVCSFITSHIYYPSVSEEWKSTDCDGDGVTNENEVDPDGNGVIQNNKTNPLSPCDLDISKQTVSPSEEWLNTDCDGDAVTNATEIADATNIFDPCSLIVENQDLTPNNPWLNTDCDADGISNAQEIEDNTNPLDSNDFFGSGDILKEIIYLDTGRIHYFTDQGAKYDRIVDADGTILTDFEYDSQDRFSSVFLNDSNGNILIEYEYNNLEISQILITQGNETIIKNVVYDNNIIYTYSTNLPQGLYDEKFTLNNSGKLIQYERFSGTGQTLSHTTKILTYDSTLNEVTEIFTSNQGYDTVTQTFFDFSGGVSYFEESETYYYSEDIINPVYEATQNLYINFILMNEGASYLSIMRYSWNYQFGVFSQTYCNQYAATLNTFDNQFNDSFGFNASNIQNNELPYLGGYSTNWGYVSDIQFLYE